MKKLTQKLVLSVLTMALVVVALGTSTFAWFTLTNKATIQTFQAQVTAGEGIEVTLGNPNGVSQPYLEPTSTTVWYTVLPTSVITEYINLRYPLFRFTDLTSPDGKTFSKYNFEDNTTTTGVVTGFIEIPLYFRSAKEQDIVWSTSVLSGNGVDWTANVASFTGADGAKYGTDESNKVIRVSAWTAARVSMTGLVGKAAPATKTVVYEEPATTKELVNNYVDPVQVGTDIPVDSYDFPTVAPFIPGAGVKGAGSYAAATGKTINLTNLPTMPVTLTAVNESVLSLKLGVLTGAPTYHSGVVTARIWIEGWDADAYDAIFNSILTVQLGFTAKTVTP